MEATNPPNPEETAWRYLLSHHLPDRYDRTLQLGTTARGLRICTRCTGQVVGAIAYFAVFVVSALFHLALFDPRTQALIMFLPLLAAWDWLTQSLGRRESNNRLRMVSGFLLGFAFADVLALLLTGQWTLFVATVAVIASYLTGLMLALWLTGGWRRVLEEHYPGLDLGPDG